MIHRFMKASEYKNKVYIFFVKQDLPHLKLDGKGVHQNKVKYEKEKK